MTKTNSIKGNGNDKVRKEKKKRFKKQTHDAVGTLHITLQLFLSLFFCRGIAK